MLGLPKKGRSLISLTGRKWLDLVFSKPKISPWLDPKILELDIDYANLERDILSRMPLGSKTYWSDWGKTSAVRIPLPGEPPWHTHDWFKDKPPAPVRSNPEYLGAQIGSTYLLKIPAAYDPGCSAYQWNNRQVIVMNFDITHPDFRIFVATPECARIDFVAADGSRIKQGWLGIKPEWLTPIKPKTCQCDIAVLMNSGCQCGLP